MDKITAKTPWKDYMGDVPMHIDYFDGSMFEAVEKVAKSYPDAVAFPLHTAGWWKESKIVPRH